MKVKQNMRWAILALTGLIFALDGTLALALPDDQQQPIKIAADTATRDERAGITIYEGNVQLTQGSLKIVADMLTVTQNGSTANIIVATGNPATLTQQPEADQPAVNASADRIEYTANENRVHLSRSARIEQDGAIVMGQTIDYLIDERRIRAGSATQQGGERVEVIIPSTTVLPEDS